MVGLNDPSSGSFMNDATVTCVLKDSEDATVTGQTFPLSLVYVPDSNGNYSAVLEDTLALTTGGTYTATVTVVSSSGINAEWQLPIIAQVRTN